MDQAIVELRQYTLHPGTRDRLIELFDREFVETQEAVGMSVIGQFRDLDRPDRFVWLRGFPNMPARAAALTAFYGGPVWAEHAPAARATMVDTTDALLLRPARPSSNFPVPAARPPIGATAAPSGIVVATIYGLKEPAEAGFLDSFANTAEPVLTANGVQALAYFVTEASPNTYPRLPVREGENVFVRFAAFSDADTYQRHLEALARSPEWLKVESDLAARLERSPVVLRLAPTNRSRLGG